VGGPIEWTVLCNGAGQIDELKDAAMSQGASIVEEATPSLEEIFIAHMGARR